MNSPFSNCVSSVMGLKIFCPLCSESNAQVRFIHEYQAIKAR